MSYTDQPDKEEPVSTDDTNPLTTVKPDHVEPLPTPAGAPNQDENTADGTGLSPLAHNPDLITDSPESAPKTDNENDKPAERPEPANTPGNEATGHIDNVILDQAGTDTVQCPICQAKFEVPA